MIATPLSLPFAPLDKWVSRTQPASEAETHHIGEATVDYCARLPLFQEYRAYQVSCQRSGRPQTNTCAWHARGEQLAVALNLAAVGAGPRHWPSKTCPLQIEATRELQRALIKDGTVAHYPSQAAWSLGLAAVTLCATPYLWTQAVLDTVVASPSLPKHVVSRTVLPYPALFWSLEGANGLRSPTGERLAAVVNWFLVFEQETRILIVHDTMPPGGAGDSIVLKVADVPYGARYPEDLPRADVSEQMLRFLSFLNSPYIGTDAVAIDRHVRRRTAQVSRAEAEVPVHVVTLRRSVQEAAADSGDGIAVERKHRWWVSGHHRAQWYPSEQAHRVIWIAPHLKGPADKPVLQKVYAVKR